MRLGLYFTYISLPDIIWIFIHIACQTKVTDLDHVVFRQKYITRCQVPVDALEIKEHGVKLSAILHLCNSIKRVNLSSRNMLIKHTFREAMYSMPRATWKLYEMRSSIDSWFLHTSTTIHSRIYSH